MEATLEVLRNFELPYEVRVNSAHRTPDATQAYVKDAEARGCAVFIAAAGMAAHLAGAVAALNGGALSGPNVAAYQVPPTRMLKAPRK